MVLRDDAQGTEVEVLPEYGALLHAFTINTPDGPLNIIDNYRDADQIQRELSFNYKGAKLSPFPCRIAGGKYEFNGRRYEFSRKFRDGSAIHGLLFDKPFTIIQERADDNEAIVALTYHYKKEDHGYPFNYTCEVYYVLTRDNELQVSTTVINHDAVDIPIADGWHPYFRLGGQVDEWYMQFSTGKMLEFNDALVPTGRLLDEPYFTELRPIGDRRLDNCFQLPPPDGSPCCTLYHPRKGLRLQLYNNGGYPYLQVYIPNERESIAIENLSAAPDAFNNDMGLTTLASGESATYSLSYKVVL